METQIKDMKLILTISGNVLTRVVEDLNGNTIWSSGEEYYDETMPSTLLDEYETQMTQLPFWNIVEVEKNQRSNKWVTIEAGPHNVPIMD